MEEKRDGEWRCLSPGGRRSSFQEETGVSFPRARRSPGSWPWASTQPLPALWEKPVATHRHMQAPGPRPKESGTHGQLLWQLRGSFHSPPRRSPRLLPELQPTGLCASQERAIKPARWRWARASPTRSRARRANLRPGKPCESGRKKPEHAECAEPGSRSTQSVPRPGFPAPPSPGTGEWRTRQVPLVTLPSRVPAKKFLLLISPAPRSLRLRAAPPRARLRAPRSRRPAPPG